MALNTSHKVIIENRRHFVAELRLRGATQREIVEALTKQKILNKDKPWSLGIINRDIQYLEGLWREQAASDIAALKGNQLAEIRAARRQAWKDSDKSEVRQLLKLEIDLLGTASPTGVKVYSWQDDVVDLLRSGRISPEDVRMAYPDLASEFFARAGVNASSND